MTVTDGNHFVVVSVGIGLFLIETDATDGTPIVEAVYPIPGVHPFRGNHALSQRR